MNNPKKRLIMGSNELKFEGFFFLCPHNLKKKTILNLIKAISGFPGLESF